MGDDSEEEMEERTRLVRPETEEEPFPSPKNITINKILPTPPSPVSTRLPSSGGGSLSSDKKSLAKPSLTPGPSAANTRFLYVSQKLGTGSAGSISRRPSVLSENSARTPKEGSSSARTANMKRDGLFADYAPVPVPPNTPDPFMRCPPSSSTSIIPDESWKLSSTASSSQLTTKALASDSDTLPDKEQGSSETLKTGSGAGPPPEALNYLRATRLGHTGLRSVGSSAFIKSLWAHRAQQRNLQHHSFFTDTTDVRQMEHALLQLLDDFHSGKLRAFAKDGSMEQMQGIREQQERLARLHFELGARQELFAPLSDEGIRANQDNMRHLMSSLQQLSQSIEKLQLFNEDSKHT